MSSHTHAFGDYKMVDSYIHKENTDIIKVECGDVIREHSIGVENCEVYKTSAITVKMDEPEDCMDLLKVVPGLCGEAHVVCSHIKIEEDISMDVQEEKDPLLVPFPIIKTEQEDTISLSQAEPNSHSETCLTSSHNENQLVSIKVEEVTDIQEEEDPLLITFPVTRAELWNTPNEQYLCGENDPYSRHQNTCSAQHPCTEGCHKSFSPKIHHKVDQRIRSHERPYSCRVCNKSFRRMDVLKEHKSVHSRERPYSCDVCNKSFSRQRYLKSHQDIIHSEVRLYSCEVCNKSFTYFSQLKRHRHIHSAERPYSCDACNKSFKCKSTLKEHERIHSVDRPYTCDVCNKSFTTISHMKKHQRIHSGERPYSCDVCNKSFSRKSDMKVHQRTHSGERPYSCSFCKKSFHRKQHSCTRSGERPYYCDECSKSFRMKRALVIHQRIHNGGYPYSCDVCKKSFLFQSHLKRHLRIHSG